MDLLHSYPVRLLVALLGVVAGAVLVAQFDLSAQRPDGAPASTSDAVLLVGRDIAPGLYRTAGAVDNRYCMWSTHSSASGGIVDNIVASDGAHSGQLIATIEPTDVLFRTRGCAPFERID